MTNTRLIVSTSMAALSALPAQAQDVQPSRSLIEVRVSGPAQLMQLMALDLDLAGCRTPLLAQRRIEVIGRPGDLARLRRGGLAATVVVPDLMAQHAAALAQHAVVQTDTLTPPIGQGAMGGHYTLAEMEAILDDFHSNYPNICSQKVSIGQSVEGRDLWMVKISDNVGVDEGEPEVLYDALHHAREPLSMSTTLLFMDELLDGYGVDPEATFLIDERELYFIPCVNPDGYEYNRAIAPNGGGMWRKNRRANGGGSFGVDLNRNYATQWSAPNGGSSTNPSSDLYRGPAPFSEPETSAVEGFSATRQFVQVFSTHSYTDVLLRPWAYQVGDPANVAAYNVLGAFMVQENGIQHGRWGSLLYISSGTSIDHHHAVRGSYAWTAELGKASEGGFWPVGPTIEAIARRHQRMFRKAALTAGAAFRVADVQFVEAAGGNGNGVIEAGETGEVVVSLDNVGAAGASLTVELLTSDPQIALLNSSVALGAVSAFASAATSATPLTFSVPSGYQGAVAPLTVRVSGDGRTQDIAAPVALLPTRTCVDDDFEADRGFARAAGGTATTGMWERAAPAQTTWNGQVFQPGAQTTPGGARYWVTQANPGTSVGSFDVDTGYTDLITPPLDLSHLVAASVAFDVHYAESTSDDALEVAGSLDGGVTWQQLYTTNTSTVGWQRLELALPTPLTDEVVVRVRAQDLSPSLVEAAVDGFEVVAPVDDGAVTMLGSGALGTSLRIGMTGPAGGVLLPLAALGLGPGLSAPGVAGTLLLDPASAALFPLQVLSAGEYAALELPLPNQASLIGVPVAAQAVYVYAGQVTFGGNAPVVTLK
ncbi:MAG: M14 family zinc carboxypeptidase [Planctomycetota bacterium]|nr:M14 family zinc carboxypeptidase [Planctomycetota bacterium]